MTVERIDVADWPLTVSVGPGWYGLRIDTDHGTAVHYLDASALARYPMRQEPDEGATSRWNGQRCPAACRAVASAHRWFDSISTDQALHYGARCEEAA